MGNSVHFALMAELGVIFLLLWRLYLAVDQQHQATSALTQSQEHWDQERQGALEKLQQQEAHIQSLDANQQQLQCQVDQQLSETQQLCADHQTLQSKYRELERDYLATLETDKELSATLQVERLDQSKLQRQLNALRQELEQTRQVHHALEETHQAIADKNQQFQKALQVAKVKLDTLEKDKKQLQRELQQALHQVVALEQEFKISQPSISPATNREPTSDEPSLPRF